MNEIDWLDAPPTTAGWYWCHHPESYEQPVLVRVEARGGTLVAHFPDLPVAVPLRMLSAARWARAVAEDASRTRA